MFYRSQKKKKKKIILQLITQYIFVQNQHRLADGCDSICGTRPAVIGLSLSECTEYWLFFLIQYFSQHSLQGQFDAYTWSHFWNGLLIHNFCRLCSIILWKFFHLVVNGKPKVPYVIMHLVGTKLSEKPTFLTP